jgi:hypothetical protein
MDYAENREFWHRRDADRSAGDRQLIGNDDQHQMERECRHH